MELTVLTDSFVKLYTHDLTNLSHYISEQCDILMCQ